MYTHVYIKFVFVYARFQILEKHWLLWTVEIYCQLCKITNLLITRDANMAWTSWSMSFHFCHSKSWPGDQAAYADQSLANPNSQI